MTIDLISPLSVRECVRRLRAASDGGWAIAGTKPVLGAVGDRSIRLRKRSYYRHSSQCWLSGHFVEEDGRTRLRCSTGLHPYVRVFLEYWIGGVLIIGGAVFFRAIRTPLNDHGSAPADLWLGIVVPLVLAGFGVIFLVFGENWSSDEPRFLIEFVERTIEAHEV